MTSSERRSAERNGTADVAELAATLAKNTHYLVFPCRLDKKPATIHGFKDASSDPDAVCALWHQYPGPLIGVATGKGSGIDVLDIDVKHPTARAWCSVARAQIPATRTYQSRAGGFHFWFRHADGIRNTESLLAGGVDTRGDGGYVIFWFATGLPCFDHAPPTEWPDWLLTLLLRKPEPAPARSSHRFRSKGGGPENLIISMLRRVEAAPEGQRHHTLRAAARTIGGLMMTVELSETAAIQCLLDAVMTAGGAAVDQRNALTTIRWGLAEGRRAPLAVS